MKRSPCRGAGQAAFTLTELAMVLLIVALLLGGLLVPLSAQVNARNSADNARAMLEIKEALLGFAAANGRLPCPAIAATPSDTAGAGFEGSGVVPVVLPGGICPNPNGVGVLPWATLGVRETDVWGRRYTYRVSGAFAQRVPPPNIPANWWLPCPYPANAAFALCSAGTLDLRSSAGGNIIAGAVPAVVISHGRNGNGAYTPQGTQLPLGADADEQDNQLTAGGQATANTDFVSKTASDTFDDEVLWLSRAVLFNRMISVGRLP